MVMSDFFQAGIILLSAMIILDHQTMFNQYQLPMKNYLIPIIIISSFLFSNCNKNKAEASFDPSLIPGKYSGNTVYYGYDIRNGDTIPGKELISHRCQYTLSNIGEQQFNLSVDNVPILPSPSIDFSIEKTERSWAYGMIYRENDPNYSLYSLHGPGYSKSGYAPPANNLAYYSNDDWLTFRLMIKKTMPDSVYFITFWGNF